ncbi:16S rRNA (adenine(1518)-N(6)/adenine(1519)-N(6))-dimethyltransferase RsmA [Nitrosomonas sp. Nm132]|uniref:16S rRNA (adenine(1518)-N(6)/adenine(1519)-N(6))- dimethyltransferase RsmA n=1 Tax=Nitrosomonas sp. Nm132 TaxID=1881053 RepID=UPI000885ABA0|nr:16S rRNA (adenine(1518)-N(6)/adenine(1519)-N(6))-dimethyltransferase RsmA [Nitrosomonas sp. Nm132]SDH79737.1 16S rRNA (adenine1518-N6/adenine1519-N6)-dimethyltransferase [Nitrosomonas sp. Nm132]
MKHIPRKRFGQNFLVDFQIIAEIIQAIRPSRGDRLVEIGPGLGALTRPLLQMLDHLEVIEVDRDIVERLRREFTEDELTIHSADALKFDFSQLGSSLRIIGNLPYNISTPLLFHLNQFCSHILDMHFMLQKEVVERMVAIPSTPDYGRLSVMLQNRFEMEQILTVPAESFRPIPKVQSAIVRMLPLMQPIVPVEEEPLFAKVVSAAFSQRRKTLRNTLRDYLRPADFDGLGLDSGLRAENLSVEQFAAIANYVKGMK